MVFLWALKNGQFKDQQRARFIPLTEEGEKNSIQLSKLQRYQAYVLTSLIIFGLLICVAVLVYAYSI
jgi:hypothetical protein